MKRIKNTVLLIAVVFTLAVGASAGGSLVRNVAVRRMFSATAPAVMLELSDSELATADLAALTTDLTNVEKVWWSGRYTHRAANRQGALVQAWEAGTVSVLGRDVDIPQATLDDLKAEINALADRMVTAQTYVANLTD